MYLRVQIPIRPSFWITFCFLCRHQVCNTMQNSLPDVFTWVFVFRKDANDAAVFNWLTAVIQDWESSSSFWNSTNVSASPTRHIISCERNGSGLPIISPVGSLRNHCRPYKRQRNHEFFRSSTRQGSSFLKFLSRARFAVTIYTSTSLQSRSSVCKSLSPNEHCLEVRIYSELCAPNFSLSSPPPS